MNNNSNNNINNILRSPEEISSSNEISSSTSPVPSAVRITTTTNSIDEKQHQQSNQTHLAQQQQQAEQLQAQPQQGIIATVNQHTKLLPSTTNATTMSYNSNNNNNHSNYNELNNSRIRINKNLMLQPNIMRTPTPPQQQAPSTNHQHHQHQQYEYYKQRERYYNFSQQQQQQQSQQQPSPTTSHGLLRHHQQAPINHMSTTVTGLNLSTNSSKTNKNNNNNIINKYRNAYQQHNGNHHQGHIGSGEFELSTDTDDESINGEPDSSNVLPPWEMAVEALRDTRPKDRERVLQLLQRFLHDNQQYRHTNVQLNDMLQKREIQIRELNEQLQHCRKQIDDLTLTARLKQQERQHNHHQQQQQEQQQQQQQPMQEEPENLKRNFSSTIVKADSCCQNEELRLPLKKTLRHELLLMTPLQENELLVKSVQPTSTSEINNETKEFKVIKLERQKSDELEEPKKEKLLYENKKFEENGEVLLAKRFKSENQDHDDGNGLYEKEDNPNVENAEALVNSKNVVAVQEEEKEEDQMSVAESEQDEEMSELEGNEKIEEEQKMKINMTKAAGVDSENESNSNNAIKPIIQESYPPTPTNDNNDESNTMILAEEVMKNVPKDEKMKVEENKLEKEHENINIKHNLSSDKNDGKPEDRDSNTDEKENTNESEIEKHAEAPHSQALSSIPVPMSSELATTAGQLFDSSNSSDATAMKQAQMCASNAVAQITAAVEKTNIDMDADADADADADVENDAEMPDDSDEEILTMVANKELTTSIITKLVTTEKMLFKKKKKKKERKERKEKRKAAAAAAAAALAITTTASSSSNVVSINSIIPNATTLRPMVTKASKKQTPITHCDLQIKQEIV